MIHHSTNLTHFRFTLWFNLYVKHHALGEFMHKRITITLDEAVYDGLYRTISKRKMSQYIEDLLRPLVLDTSLDSGYRAMAADKAREAEAQELGNALNKTI